MASRTVAGLVCFGLLMVSGAYGAEILEDAIAYIDHLFVYPLDESTSHSEVKVGHSKVKVRSFKG